MSANSTRGMVCVGRRLRAYFAPVERGAEAPTTFDPAKAGRFALDAPPSPWLDLGWIENFGRSSSCAGQAMRTGMRGGIAAQFRGPLEARVEFDFEQWGKLQMALAGGSEHMNVLEADAAADPRASGSTAIGAVPLLGGSSAQELVLGTGAVDGWQAGDLVAVDVDFEAQTGYLGTGIAAAHARAGAQYDRDYVRRVTYNVGRIGEKTAVSVLLAQPLLGGTPAKGAAAQRVIGFVDRDGGSFFQEWSALFVLEGESGGRICWHYPRLSPNGSEGADARRETEIEIGAEARALALHASFVALPQTDPVDGETAVSYRSYFPPTMSAVY